MQQFTIHRCLNLLALQLLYNGVDGAIPQTWKNYDDIEQSWNEWGTYYTLPSEYSQMLELFSSAFKAYLNSGNPSSSCREGDAQLEKWYKNYNNNDLILLSYYCRTKGVHNYEHIKVSKTKKQVLQFSDRLEQFQIVDARDYEEQLPREIGQKKRIELLGENGSHLRYQIAEQKETDSNSEKLCPNPGLDTFEDVWTKRENGLVYYKMAISCSKIFCPNHAHHMTHIEVAVDEEFKKLRSGYPTLVSMELPSLNNPYIRQVKSASSVPGSTVGFNQNFNAAMVATVAIWFLQFFYK